MKRKNASRSRIGYHQLENRWLLAAIANGQEIEGGLGIGEIQTFEFEVDALKRVHVTLSETTGDFGDADLNILGPSGAVQFSTLGNSGHFDPVETGTYRLVVSEFGNDETLQFRIRAVTFSDEPIQIEGRDFELQNGEELLLPGTRDANFSNLAFFPIDIEATGDLLVSVSRRSNPGNANGFRPLLYNSDGDLVPQLFIESSGPSLGQYSIQELGRYYVFADELRGGIDYAVRAIAFGSEPTLLPERDVFTTNGVQQTVELISSSISLIQFEADSAGSLYFAHGVSSPSFDTVIKLFGPNGTEVPRAIFSSDGEGINYTLPTPGRYSIATIWDLASFSPNTLQFTARPSFLPGDPAIVDELDFELVNGEEFSFAFAPTNTPYFYSFIEEGQQVIVSTLLDYEFPSSTTLRAVGPDGTLYGFNSNVLEFQAEASGIYRFFPSTQISAEMTVRSLILPASQFTRLDGDATLENGVVLEHEVFEGRFNVLNLPISEAGRVRVSAVNNGFSSADVRIYSPSGELLASVGNSPGRSVDFEADAPGDYLVVVQGTGRSSLYNIRAIVFPGEPGLADGEEILRNGEELVLDLPAGGTILTPLQVDQTGPVLVSIKPLDGFLENIQIHVFDSNGNELDIPASPDSSSAFELRFDANSAGQYHVLLANESNSRISGVQVRWLSFVAEPILISGRDQTIAVGSIAQAFVSERNISVLQFEVSSQGLFSVSVSEDSEPVAGFSSLIVEVYGPDGQLLDSQQDSTSLVAVLSAAEAGTYHVVLRRPSFGAGPDYNVLVQRVDETISLTSGTEIIDSIGLLGSRVFALQASRTGTIFASVVDEDSAETDGMLFRLYSPSGELLAEDEVSFFFDNPNLTLQAEVSETGTYALVLIHRFAEIDANLRIRAVLPSENTLLIPNRDLTLVDAFTGTVSSPPNASTVVRFGIETAGPAVFTALPAAGSASAGVRVFSPDGRLVSSSNGVFGADTTGTYIAILTTGDGETEQQLDIRAFPASESSGLIEGQDQTVVVGEEVQATVPVRGNSFFPIELDATETITFFVSSLNSNVTTPIITLRDPNGNFIIGTTINRRPSTQVTYRDLEAGFYVAEVSNAAVVRFRTIGVPNATALIDDRGFVIEQGGPQTSIVPARSVGLFPVNLTAGEEGRFFLDSDSVVSLLDPNGEEIGFTQRDGIAAFTATLTGVHAFRVFNESSFDSGFSASLFPSAGGNDRELTPSLDQPIQNGQEITAVLPAGGHAVIPLDLDFSRAGFGELQVSGVSDGFSSSPLVQIFDSDGILRSENDQFVPFGLEFGTFLTLPSENEGPLFAIITNPSTSDSIEYRLRALRHDGASTLIPGRDAVLENGVPSTSTLPLRQIAQFPVEVTSPGTITVDIDLTPTEAAIQNAERVGAIARVVSPFGVTQFFRTEFEDFNFEFEAVEGPYTILVEHVAQSFNFFEAVPDLDDLQFEITANGISQVSLAVTSFERDARISSREEVLAQPDSVNQLTLRFNQDVAIEINDLVLRNDSIGGELVDISGAGFSYNPSTWSATWDLSTLETPLPAAFYSASLAAGSVASIASGESLVEDFSSRFHVALAGDTNLDGVVDVLNDAFALVGNLGRDNQALWSDGDFGGNGSVTVLDDAFALVGNLGRSIVPTEVLSFLRDDTPTNNQNQLVRPDLLENLTVDFSVDVDVESTDLVLLNETTNSLVDLANATFIYNTATHRAQWDLSTLATPLPAGFYSIQILADSVTERANGQSLLGDYSDQFYVALRGDANLDGTVDVLNDAFQLVGNLGRTEFSSWALGDFNDDDRVDVLGDAFILTSRLGQSVTRDAVFANLS